MVYLDGSGRKVVLLLALFISAIGCLITMACWLDRECRYRDAGLSKKINLLIGES